MNGNPVLSDTNPLIYLLNGSKIASDYLNGKQVWISFITELELFAKKGLTKGEINEIELLTESCNISDMNSEIKKITKSFANNKNKTP